MRTTITLEPDVAERIRQASLSGKRSQKAIINEALRRGLGVAHEQEVEERFKVRPIRSAFRSGVDIGKLNQLVDEVEAESYLRRERGT
ncbi:MAG TPA: ribbon-helix-helix protein, CopG family [Oceanipulchritudo sp.]|nr:ribbon-helix-helix protein, CopG family [Oceanipulchritudo sp.]